MTSTTAQPSTFTRGAKSTLWLRLRHHALSWPALVGLLVLAVYLGLLPFIARTWRATGDEPHYLLAAHSLVADGDFDLANNYAAQDYLRFYYSQDITPQVRLDRAGQQILNHYPAYSFLIAPAYAVGGRLGVLLFQALLAGGLAAVTFKLAQVVSGEDWAALLATLMVTLSPPLLMYPYLLYPELVAAGLTTWLLYLFVSRNRAGVAGAVVLLLTLALFPWLNRRFIPLALLLLLLAGWSWRGHQQGWRAFLSRLNVAALLVTGLSLAGIIWYNSQLSAPARVDIVAPPSGMEFWSRLVRGVGWLLDQERGLFIFAPVYVLALWGVPLLIERSLTRQKRDWLVLLPFGLSLGMASVAGGFWVAYELGPRFLVIGLPGLAPLLALAWRAYRRSRLWLGWALLLALLSLLNSWVIVQNSELPYKSSLPLYYGDWLDAPLADYLPDLARFARLEPAGLVQPGDPVLPWFKPAGERVRLVDSVPLVELPFGHYRLRWTLATQPGLPPETELVRLTIKHLGGGQVFHRTVTAADLPSDGGPGTIEASFFNPQVEYWRTPMVVHAVAGRSADLWADYLLLTPDPFYALLLPYGYLLLLGLAALGAWYRCQKRWLVTPAGSLPALRAYGWLGLLLPLAALGYLGYAQSRTTQTYDAAGLLHFVGQPMADPAAQDGRAWQVDPATDPPQRAIYGPFDFYDAGQYRVTFRLKLAQPVEKAGQDVARLQVNATANFEPLVTQPLRADHFSRPGLYHDMVLTIDNPRRQALSFDVHYLAAAPLVIDGVTIAAVGGEE